MQKLPHSGLKESLNARPDEGGFIVVGDMRVNRMGFGAMRLCGDYAWGGQSNAENADKVLRRAIDLGVNFIDTADSYGPRVNEEQIARALWPYPAGLVVATKGGLLRPNKNAWVPDGRPEHLRHAVEGSLRRLKVERIDLYQLHAPDPKVPLVDSFGALADLRSEGKIRHLGISNINVEQLDVARSIAPVVTVQNAFNLRNRDSQNVLEACEKLGIAFLPWFPLGGKRGMRAGKVRSLAEKNGLSVQELSIAWLLSRSSAMLPIPGTNSLEHLVKNMRASSVRLSQDDLNALH